LKDGLKERGKRPALSRPMRGQAFFLAFFSGKEEEKEEL